MAVFHILKDGSRVDDITGRVVRPEDAEPLYRFLHSFTNERSKEKSNTYEQQKQR